MSYENVLLGSQLLLTPNKVSGGAYKPSAYSNKAYGGAEKQRAC